MCIRKLSIGVAPIRVVWLRRSSPCVVGADAGGPGQLLPQLAGAPLPALDALVEAMGHNMQMVSLAVVAAIGINAIS